MKVYMDNAATTKVDSEAAKAMQRYLETSYGNPSSVHFLGTEAEEAINNARKIIAKKINSEPKEVIFTSGGAESNNYLIKGLMKASGKKHIVVSAVEHASVILTCEKLEKEGYKVTYVKVDKDGMVNPKDVEISITKDTAIVSIMHANNEVGTIEPIKEIGNICKKKKVLFHTDAVQSFLKLPIDVKKMNIDAMSISSHKVHGPKGVGAAYIRSGIVINKLIEGGRQEFNLRGGTQNVPGIVGFGKAIEVWKEKGVKKLRDYMIKRILKEVKDSKLNGHKTKRLQNNVNVSFNELEGETILLHLSYLGVAVATGSACHERAIKVSHVLYAMGMEKKVAKGAVRFTLSRYTTKKEVDYAVDNLKTVVESLRRLEE